jgi:hypothetical protein
MYLLERHLPTRQKTTKRTLVRQNFYDCERFSRTVFRTRRPNSSWNIRVICRQVSANIPFGETR